MLPGSNTVLSDAVRQHHADVASRLVQDDAYASKVFDAAVRKMRAARGLAG